MPQNIVQKRGKPKRTMLYLVSLLPALLLIAGVLTLLPAHKSYAAATGVTCATAPANQKPQFCDGKDPIAEQCVTDATTVDHVFIHDSVQVIGRLDLRFSQRCDSYWGRIISYLPNSYLYLQVEDLGSGPKGSFYGTFNDVYSNMLFFYQPTLSGYMLAEKQQFDVHLNPPPGQ